MSSGRNAKLRISTFLATILLETWPFGPDSRRIPSIRLSSALDRVSFDPLFPSSDQSFVVELKPWRSGKRVGRDAVSDFMSVIVSEVEQEACFCSTSGYAADRTEGPTEVVRDRLWFGEKSNVVLLAKTYIMRMQWIVVATRRAATGAFRGDRAGLTNRNAGDVSPEALLEPHYARRDAATLLRARLVPRDAGSCPSARRRS